MANLTLALAELVAGGILVDAAVKGASITDVVTGKATQKPIGGLNGSSSTAGAAGGAATSTPTAAGHAGAVKMLAAAQAAEGTHYNVGGHDAVNATLSILRSVGTDCSGFISYLMGRAGAGLWSQSYATPGIPSAPGVLAGEGTYVTMWNDPRSGSAGHVFIQILGQWFEDAGGIGVHSMSQSQVDSYMASGSYTPYHPQGM